jgi:hypothetical protein
VTRTVCWYECGTFTNRPAKNREISAWGHFIRADNSVSDMNTMTVFTEGRFLELGGQRHRQRHVTIQRGLEYCSSDRRNISLVGLRNENCRTFSVKQRNVTSVFYARSFKSRQCFELHAFWIQFIKSRIS